jgi:hypothetical protein
MTPQAEQEATGAGPETIVGCRDGEPVNSGYAAYARARRVPGSPQGVDSTQGAIPPDCAPRCALPLEGAVREGAPCVRPSAAAASARAAIDSDPRLCSSGHGRPAPPRAGHAAPGIVISKIVLKAGQSPIENPIGRCPAFGTSFAVLSIGSDGERLTTAT